MTILVKLNNGNQTTGRMECEFKESITLPAKSRMALLNAAISVEQRMIKVTADNKNMQFKLATNNVPLLNVTLDEGLYNLEEFRLMVQKKMNSAMLFLDPADATQPYELNQNGFQWKIMAHEGTKMKIMFNRTDRYQQLIVPQVKEHMDITDAASNIPGTTTKNKIYKKDAGDPDIWNSWVVGQKYMTNGCGAMNCKIPTGVVKRFCIGLLDYYPKAGSTLEPSKYNYSLYGDVDGGGATIKYHITYLDSVLEPQAEVFDINVLADDDVQITISGGSLGFWYRRDGDTDYVKLKEIDWDYTQHNYPGVSLYTADSTLENVVYYQDPYHRATIDEREYQEYTDPIIQAQNLEALVGTRVFIDFLGNNALYGFANSQYFQNAVRYTFEGDNALDSSNLPLNLKVEVENMKLTSYDSFLKKRESILMSLPVLVYDGAKIVYDRQNPIYIDLNNEHPITLNQIVLRFMTFNNKLIKVVADECDVTLLIDN